MERYRIADEIIGFELKNKENKNRFKSFQITEEDSEGIIRIEESYLVSFQNQHRNLSLVQCELILSMRYFYDYLISKDKLFMHAAVVVKNDYAYIIIAPPGGGKSTFAKHIVKYQTESAFIFADDRIVIANKKGTPVVWTTPWSKIINGNPTLHYVVKAFCIVRKSDDCSICCECEEEIIKEIINEYPKECWNDVDRILHTINLEKCNLIRVQSNNHYLSISNIFEMATL